MSELSVQEGSVAGPYNPPELVLSAFLRYPNFGCYNLGNSDYSESPTINKQ